ncbi:MAG: hypothetical protein EHM15_03810 [Desulfobacteraceae bacterium]|nr:MAG: hypothetical protein EHM15_03810 [Desulfobacteraceae bacterium]
MIVLLKKGKPVFILMIALGLLISLPHPSALAALVPTDATLDLQNETESRAKVLQFLAREDVRAALIAEGIDPAEADARVAGLTDAEVAQIAERIDELPAGGILGAVILVLVIVLLVVLILKLAGKI